VTAEISVSGGSFHTFESKLLEERVSFHIYIPEIYNRQKDRRFPVLYWLHGTNGGLPGIRPLSRLFDRAIQYGKIPPMLVVFPNGLETSMWCDSKDGKVPMESVFIKELLPYIDSNFRTLAKREGRLIEGFSMGGQGAARLGLKYPDLFGAVSILAGGPLDMDFQGPRARRDPAERNRIMQSTYGGDIEYYRAQNPYTIARQYAKGVKGVILRIVVGKKDHAVAGNRAYSEYLEALSIGHSYQEVPGVGHSAMRLFRGLNESNWKFYRQAFDEHNSRGIREH
jgi:enterochelin esterase-like enzyme